MLIQKKVRFFFHFLSAIIKKQLRNIIIGILLGVFFYFSAPFVIKTLLKQKPFVVIGRIGQFTTNEIPDDILSDISFGLTKVTDKSEVLPSLAESWSSEDDEKTFRFKLKKKITDWHDGEKFTPYDINYNFKDVVLSSENNEIIFKLKEPFSPFPAIVSKPIFKKGLIGLGNYKVKKIIKSGKYVKSILLVPASPDLSLLAKMYKFYLTEKDLKTAFNLGEVNVAESLSDHEGILPGKAVESQKILRTDAYLALFFNTSKPTFQQKNFRQALAYAIPKDSEEKRALTSFNPASWAYNQDIKPYNEDLARAKLLIEKELPSLKNITITLSTPPQYEKTARQIGQAWEKLGIQTKIEIFSFIPNDYDVILVAREIPLEPDQYYFWHSTQAGNLSNFKNPRIDKLLEDGRRTYDKEERKDIYFDFQRFLAEECPAVFLSHPESWTVSRRSVLQ